MAACTHPSIESSGRYISRGRSVYRVDRCAICQRVIREKRSRWKSRSDRWIKVAAEQAARKRKQHAWRYHDQQAAERKQRARLKDPIARLLDAMREVEREAKDLPQDDDRLWKYHPVARRWRRLMRAWWRLSATGVLNRQIPQDERPRMMRTSAAIERVGSAPDVQHGREAKIKRLIGRAEKIDGTDWYQIGSYQFRLFEKGA